MKIIITETQLKNILDEATFERDHKYYKEAEQFYNDIIKTLEKGRDYILKFNDDNIYFFAYNVNNAYNDLLIKFVENLRTTEKANGAHVKLYDNDRIIKMHIDSAKISSSDILRLLKENSKFKDTFIHEFIHYLDSHRYKNIGLVNKPKDGTHSNSDTSYYFTTVNDANKILRNNNFKLQSLAKKIGSSKLENFYYLPISKNKNKMPKYTTAIMKIDVDKFKRNVKTFKLASDSFNIQENEVIITNSEFINDVNDYIISIDFAVDKNVNYGIYNATSLRIPINLYKNKKDLLLSNNPLDINKFLDSLPDESYTEYFNKPQEFNAFYQQTAGKLVKDMHKRIETIQNTSFPNFAMFYLGNSKLAAKNFREDFISYLNDKNYKKIIKRLYNIYAYIHSLKNQKHSSEITDTTKNILRDLRKIYLDGKDTKKSNNLLSIAKKHFGENNQDKLEEYIIGKITLDDLIKEIFEQYPVLKKYENDENLMFKFKNDFKIWINTQSAIIKLRKQFKK